MLTDPTDFCRLILLRHPEVDPAFANVAVGDGDATLGRRGQAQVLAWLPLFEDLNVSAIHTAAQSQCLDPARALAAHRQIEVHADPRLNDQDMGEWQGRAWDDLVRDAGERVRGFFADFGEAAPPEGESLGQAVERMFAWWHDLAPEASGQTVVVVVPGAMIAGFATGMLGMRLSRSVSLNLPPGAMGILDCFANGARVVSWNPTALARQP